VWPSIGVRRIAYVVKVLVTIWCPTGRHIIAESVAHVGCLSCSTSPVHSHIVHILVEGDPVRTSRQADRSNVNRRPLPCTNRCRNIIRNQQATRRTGIVRIYCSLDTSRVDRIDADLCYGPSLRQGVLRSNNVSSQPATTGRPSGRRCAKRVRLSASSHSYRARASRILNRCPDAVNHACHSRPDGRRGPASRRREEGCRDSDIRRLLREERGASIKTRTQGQQHHKYQQHRYQDGTGSSVIRSRAVSSTALLQLSEHLLPVHDRTFGIFQPFPTMTLPNVTPSSDMNPR
jgi:hypothetical protein